MTYLTIDDNEARQLMRMVTERTSALGDVPALAAVALVSVAIGAPGRVRIANVSILYVFAVLACVITPVAAFLTFDWFFVEPLHQWKVANPSGSRFSFPDDGGHRGMPPQTFASRWTDVNLNLPRA